LDLKRHLLPLVLTHSSLGQFSLFNFVSGSRFLVRRKLLNVLLNQFGLRVVAVYILLRVVSLAQTIYYLVLVDPQVQASKLHRQLGSLKLERSIPLQFLKETVDRYLVAQL